MTHEPIPDSGKEAPQEPRFLAVGQIVAPFGIHGAVKVDVMTDFPERFASLGTVFLGEEHTPYELVGQNLRPGNRQVVLQFHQVVTRDAAESLRGRIVYIPVEQAAPLQEGQFFQYQVIGLAVLTESGELLGQVTDILPTGSNDVYVVQGPRGEILIPALDDVVLKIDLGTGTITVQLPAGLAD